MIDVDFNNTILLNEYKNVLAVFCQYISILNQQMDLKERLHEEFDSELINETLKRVSKYKEKLLAIKKELGLPGGLDFLDDNNYDGFSISNGRFYGDAARASLVTEKWLSGFPKTANNYQYEAAVYVMFMAYPNNPDLPKPSRKIRYFPNLLSIFKGGKQCKTNLSTAS